MIKMDVQKLVISWDKDYEFIELLVIFESVPHRERLKIQDHFLGNFTTYCECRYVINIKSRRKYIINGHRMKL